MQINKIESKMLNTLQNEIHDAFLHAEQNFIVVS